VRLKYVKGLHVCSIPNRYNDSLVWCDLLKVSQIYLKGRKFKINNGRLVSFCLDIWLGDKPLCQKYPILYELCEEESSVYQVQQKSWAVKFRSHLPSILTSQWYELADRLSHVGLSGGQDVTI
jgi:hypothetical protein